MSYTIKIADIHDPRTDLALRTLIKETYNTPSLIPERFLASNIESHASQPGFFLIAQSGDEVVGCNAFMANDFELHGVNYVGYQSCWSVTHPAHQGKGIFSDLINEAKKMLRAQGAGFLYGIANNRSNPIITKKLGFVEMPSLVVRIPDLPVLKSFFFTKKAWKGNDNACLINEQQVLDHKLAQSSTDVKVARHHESMLWGKLLRKKKYGIYWDVFYVGGVHLKNENDLEPLVKQLLTTHGVSFVQFFSCGSNSVNGLLRGWTKPNTNGFIYFNLHMPAFEHFNLMIGAIDTF